MTLTPMEVDSDDGIVRLLLDAPRFSAMKGPNPVAVASAVGSVLLNVKVNGTLPPGNTLVEARFRLIVGVADMVVSLTAPDATPPHQLTSHVFVSTPFSPISMEKFGAFQRGGLHLFTKSEIVNQRVVPGP